MTTNTFESFSSMNPGLIKSYDLKLTDKVIGRSFEMGIPIYEWQDGILFTEYPLSGIKREGIIHVYYEKAPRTLYLVSEEFLSYVPSAGVILLDTMQRRLKEYEQLRTKYN